MLDLYLAMHTVQVHCGGSDSSAELQARRVIDCSTTIDIRFVWDSMVRRVRNNDYSSATYRD
jgi:hypothetical protein